MVVGWLDSRESLQNKELNKRNITWKTSLLFTNIQSIPAYSWSVAKQRQLRKTMVTRVTKMGVIKVIKFNVKFNVGEIVDKGMQLHIDKGQEAENCRRVGGTKSENLADVFCSVRFLVGDSQQVDTASHSPTFSITDSDTSFEQVHII